MRGIKPQAAWRLVLGLLVVLSGSPDIRASESIAEEPLRERLAASGPIDPPSKVVRVGERLTFQGRWLGLPVGSGWIEVKERLAIHGRSVYLIEAHGRSNAVLDAFYPIRDTVRVYLDAERLQPLRFEKSQREGRYRSEEIVTFDYVRLIATYESLLNGSIKEIPIPADVHDMVSAFYWLRTHAVDPNQPTQLNLYADEKVYQTSVTPRKRVTLELLKRGVFPCLVVEPSASFKGVLNRRGRMLVYVTTDAQRIPLFVKISTPWGLIAGIIDEVPHG